MKKKNSGFTLIELVLYMGILSILILVLSSLFASIISVQLESKSTSSVDQDGRYILSRLLYEMRTADSIVVPSVPGSQSATLQLSKNSIIYTYSLDNNSNLQIKIGSSSAVNVFNGYDTKVTGLNFLRLGGGGTSDTVQVNFTVTSRIIQPKGQESRTFQTTLGK